MQSIADFDTHKILARVAEQFCEDHAPYIEAPEKADAEEQRVVRQFVEALLY